MTNHYELVSYNMDEEEISQKTNSMTSKKTGKRKYFPSNSPQSLIRNAITGVEYPYYTGTKEQSLLFKCVDSTGTCDSQGYFIKSGPTNYNTNHLFYDSPEQCMRHLHISFSSDFIKKWHDSQPEQQIDSIN